MTVLEAHHLSRVLGDEVKQTILDDVSLAIDHGELVALTGASGSGKSTLLYLLGLLDRPTGGRLLLDGVDVSGLDDDARADLRNHHLGYVFQFHFLLPELTVLENVSLPLRRRGLARADADDRAHAALVSLSLAELDGRKPSQLSGGQQQRVSIARAIAGEPAIVLADEPTGNLDSKNAEAVFAIFTELARARGATVVMVTHERSFAAAADRRLELKDGRLVPP